MLYSPLLLGVTPNAALPLHLSMSFSTRESHHVCFIVKTSPFCHIDWNHAAKSVC